MTQSSGKTPHVIPELDRAGLREFGLIMAAAVPLLFGLFLPWQFERSWPIWPWVFGAVFLTWSLTAPDSLKPVYRVWMRFGHLMGRIVTPVILTATFVIAILPTGLIMRMAGRDPMHRRFDPEAETYRVPSVANGRERLEKPF
ncbi:MAG: SxtJ family membrane protein [Gammaproteobacteria bacterium]